MSDPKLGYWEECLSQSFEENGVIATPEQIQAIAEDIETARDCMYLAFHVPENPLIEELERTKKALDIEKRKVVCPDCLGTGRDRYYAAGRLIDTGCHPCSGKGYILP